MQSKVSKERYRVVIILDNMTVTGNIHIMPRSRLTDVLNSNHFKDFIPVTDAEIEIYNTDIKKFIDLIEVNKSKIKAIYPVEDGI